MTNPLFAAVPALAPFVIWKEIPPVPFRCSSLAGDESPIPTLPPTYEISGEPVQGLPPADIQLRFPKPSVDKTSVAFPSSGGSVRV